MALKVFTAANAGAFTIWLTQTNCMVASLSFTVCVWAHLYIVWYAGATWKGHPTINDMENISKQIRDSPEAVAEAPAVAAIRAYPGYLLFSSK